MKKDDSNKKEEACKSESEDTEDIGGTEDSEGSEDSEYIEEVEDDTEEVEDDTEEVEDDTEEVEDDTEEYFIDNGLDKICNKDCHNEIINNYQDNKDNPENYFNKYQEEHNNQMIYLILNTNNTSNTSNKNKARNSVLKLSKHPINKKTYRFYNKYSSVEKKYFDVLSDADKARLTDSEDIIEKTVITYDVPMRFKILSSDINIRTKKSIIWKIESLNKMNSNSSEYYKLSSWISSLNNIPFNKFYEIPIKIADGNEKICNFLNNIRARMDETIFGHKDAKEQIVRVLAQLISFPKANGYIIGIQGSAGVGKTKLIKEGICNALNYPNAFISLSGTDDSSFLKGHSYTYEGSTYGKICESLMKTGIMNPLFLFDELDKVSNTYKGQEIINTLIHITDPVQNDKFNDRYFEEIDFDISRSMIIFTYNDDSLINPILRDRMIVINVSGYDNEEKIVLASGYIIPEILKQYNLNNGDIIFSSELLRHIINNIEKEDGVRNLKRAINNIVSWINMMIYVPTDLIKINIPYTVTQTFYDTYCKKYNSNSSISVKYNSIYL
jgi:ATP-dependent Lon protease